MLNCLADASQMIAMGLTPALELPKSSSTLDRQGHRSQGRDALEGGAAGRTHREKKAQEVVR